MDARTARHHLMATRHLCSDPLALDPRLAHWACDMDTHFSLDNARPCLRPSNEQISAVVLCPIRWARAIGVAE